MIINRSGWLILLVIFLLGCSGGEKTYYAVIETEYGTMKAVLYNTTPQHRDNFVKLAKEDFYDGLLFHRIIPGFMIQGGDPESKNAPSGQRLGMGGPGYQIPQEIGAPHFRGTLAAARTPNPEKASSGSQFYIVQGQKQSRSSLEAMAARKQIAYNETQIQKYLDVGGRPDLDMEYTVFGEIVSGMDVIDKISAVERDGADRPLIDVTMNVRITNN